MNPTKQRIAIAEACGWTFITHGDHPYGLPPNDKTALRESVLPDYLNDLNAMHTAEVLNHDKFDGYYYQCLELCCFRSRNLHGPTGTLAVGFSGWIAHASAPQRAEAFLKTLELWEENSGIRPNPARVIRHTDNQMTNNETTNPEASEIPNDYYSVYVKRKPKDRGNFLCNVLAKSTSDAMRIARAHGHTLPRGSYSVRIGKEGYYAALRYAF